MIDKSRSIKNKEGRTLFMLVCDKCGKDRGYGRTRSSDKLCNSCTSKITNKVNNLQHINVRQKVAIIKENKIKKIENVDRNDFSG